MEHFVEGFQQSFGSVGFGDEIVDGIADQLGGAVVGAKATGANDFHGRIDCAKGDDASWPIHHRHHHVGEHGSDFGCPLRIQRDCLSAV